MRSLAAHGLGVSEVARMSYPPSQMRDVGQPGFMMLEMGGERLFPGGDTIEAGVA